jgi:hypothetical protein
MQIDQWNHAAAQALLADADRTMALTHFDDATADQGVAQKTIATVHKNYSDLLRRSVPLIMSDADQIKFQRKMDRLRACLKFFGESV